MLKIIVVLETGVRIEYEYPKRADLDLISSPVIAMEIDGVFDEEDSFDWAKVIMRKVSGNSNEQ